MTVRHHYIKPARKVQGEDAPIISYLTLVEMVVFVGLGRLRFGRYVGTAGELYFHLTGRKHPKAQV